MTDDVLVYYINFGPHGPRAEKVRDGWQVAGGVATCVFISFIIFWGLRQYSIALLLMNVDDLVSPPPPRTMTREWQEATNQRMKELGIEPISGPGSEGYKVGSPRVPILMNRVKVSFMEISSIGRAVLLSMRKSKSSEGSL